MRGNLVVRARRARPNPLKKRDIDRVERDLKSLVAGARHDKKSRAGQLRCVMIEELGRVASHEGNWSHPVTVEELLQVLA